MAIVLLELLVGTGQSVPITDCFCTALLCMAHGAGRNLNLICFLFNKGLDVSTV